MSERIRSILGWRTEHCGLRDLLATIDARGPAWTLANVEPISAALAAYARAADTELNREAAAAILKLAAAQASRTLRTDLTITVTTYLRPASVARFIASVERHAPDCGVLMEDTRGNLSAARNRLVERVQTPYFVLCEDDFEITAETDLDGMVTVLNHDAEIAMCGGIVDDHRPIWALDFELFRGELRLVPARARVKCTPDGLAYRPCDCLANFGVIRTDVARSIPWDERLPLMEHVEWFWRLRRQWRVAILFGCSIKHYVDRPSLAYEESRSRAKQFRSVAEKIIGATVLPPAPSSQVEHPPSIVILGIGHANTTITSRQIGALGWHLGPVDEYAELPAVRDINEAYRRSGSFDLESARRILASLPRPWVIKDPRFRFSLSRWLPVFAEYEPLLIWITKDLGAIAASYHRRGETCPELRRELALCQRQFSQWPWAKLSVRAEAIASAVQLFDLGR